MSYQPMFGSLPQSRQSRWATAEKFCRIWGVPWEAGGTAIADQLDRCEQRLGILLPESLREWYQINGAGIENWVDALWLKPDQLKLDEERRMLVFRTDDYAPEDPDWISGIRIDDLSQEDPPVWYVDILMKRRNPDGDSFSIHAMRQSFTNAKSCAELKTIEELPDLEPATLFALNSTLQEQFTPAALGRGQYFLYNSSVIHEGADMFAIVSRTCVPNHQEEGSLYFAFRNAAAAEQIPARLGRHMGLWSPEPGPIKYLTNSRTKVASEMLAQDARQMADVTAESLRNLGFTANFTIPGLTEIDRFFEEYSQEGKFVENCPLSELCVPRIPALGAYLGETIIRSVGGHWEENSLERDPFSRPDPPDPFERDATIQLIFENGTGCWPVARIRKRLLHGAEDGIAAYGYGAADLAREERTGG